MNTTASYAADPATNQGRCYLELPPTYRTEFQRDRDRIIHAKAFRRLEYKTQVFVNHEGDLYRTRLTHSLEVAQIARSVARNMGLNEDLTEAIALAHDLGHTPFGHAGQDELNACMQNYGGFEHNLQSLRVVDWLEDSYADFPGLNLTFETREGILKHCSVKQAKQLGEVAERFVNKTQTTLEAQLTNLADEIAYTNHDIEDGLRSGLITLEQLQSVSLFAEEYQKVKQQYAELHGHRLIREILRGLIGRMVADLIESSRSAIQQSGVQTLADVRSQFLPLMCYSDTMHVQKNALKRFLHDNLYFHPKVYRMSWRARKIIRALFEAYMQDTRLLTPKYQNFAKEYEAIDGKAGQARAIADFIAGMTDRYAVREYGQLFDVSGIR